MIAATRGGWAIEASIGAVGALKDQLGVCRWNYVIRSVEQRAKSRVQTYYYKHVVSLASAAGAPSDSRAPAGNMLGLQERAERREQRVKKDWESMSLSEKAVRLYVGEKGLLFWLTNSPTLPSSS
ncbi:hypothetical protein SASPL_130721 [Salvia splendens]|uniref:Uncharacterized protein n=1 Tax=Salvia splendens TaxID=180675 RepID=A0A8X8X7X4_SALSN|nr:hypothetical protein SASPL_130721 [Salvia splendens]